MNRSRFDSRAKLIHKQKNELPVDMARDEYWKKYVKGPEDVVQFYKLYYPQLPDVLVQALANYYNRAVIGEIELPDNFIEAKAQKKFESSRWDFKKDIEEQQLEGKINLTKKRLEELMNE